MSEFKKGDRVRALVDWIDVEAGEVYEVARIDEDGDVRVVVGGLEFYMADHELEPALRIEAGKFYKTRDGRKVGPMLDDWEYDSVYHFRTTSGALSGCLWRADGQQYNNTNPEVDLIAEWSEPARVNVAATVDAIADEYGSGARVAVQPAPAVKAKFKVGDRVAGRHPFAGEVAGKLVEIDTRDNWLKYRIDNTWVTADSITHIAPTFTSAIVCLIEDGQPKPSHRPYVHASVESAETEAKRLAGVHTGQQFGVYALTGEPAVAEKKSFTEELVIKLTLDTSNFEREIARARQSLVDLEQRARRNTRRLAA